MKNIYSNNFKYILNRALEELFNQKSLDIRMFSANLLGNLLQVTVKKFTDYEKLVKTLKSDITNILSNNHPLIKENEEKIQKYSKLKSKYQKISKKIINKLIKSYKEEDDDDAKVETIKSLFVPEIFYLKNINKYQQEIMSLFFEMLKDKKESNEKIKYFLLAKMVKVFETVGFSKILKKEDNITKELFSKELIDDIFLVANKAGFFIENHAEYVMTNLNAMVYEISCRKLLSK